MNFVASVAKMGAGFGPSKGSVESEHGVWGDAVSIAWNRSNDHRAGRQALTIDNDKHAGVRR
jgi:hypothetical protein